MTTLRRSFLVPRGVIFCIMLITIFNSVESRAVNISNTWILPEEGFPVFYRYFRDRISWYEADAVCQFHHANLVTVDTTAQYDAARAYLKELDIMSNVWIGLIKSNEEGDFTWTDYKPLTGEGYWETAPEVNRTPLCTALDPAKDFRWSALSCGGPQVASFICELTVPTWALKPEGGCLVKSLPSLTVQFLPELAAVQLISDCGLDGTKQVTCKSNESHPDVLKELSCAIPEEDFVDNQVTAGDTSSSGSPNPSHPDVSTFTTQGPGDYSTRARRETNPPSLSEITTSIPQTNKPTEKLQSKPLQTIPVQIVNSLTTTTPSPVVSKTTPKLTERTPSIKMSTPHSEITDESLVSENPTKPSITTTTQTILNQLFDSVITTTERPEKSKTDTIIISTKSSNTEQKTKGKEHHENVFTVPTDHFIPPLVMAKSKVGNDMTVVSLEEKHQQQKYNHKPHTNEHSVVTVKHDSLTTSKPQEMETEIPETTTVTQPLSTTTEKAATPKPKPLVVKPVIASTTIPTVVKTQETTSIATEKHIEDNVIDRPDMKIRKPSKGKKYDKFKEEKKIYKQEEQINKKIEILDKFKEEKEQYEANKKQEDEHKINKQEEQLNKIIEVTIPNSGINSTPLTVVEVTTKAAAILSTVTTQAITTEKTQMTQQLTNVSAMPVKVDKSNITLNGTKENKKTLIDPNLQILNNGNLSSVNNESEIIIKNNTKVQEVVKPEEEKEKLTTLSNKTVNKPIQSEINLTTEKNDERMDQTPDPIPRPNRSRTLTQPPQHRSFYPYLFNRVLG